MKATAIEFRLRMWVFVALCFVGFWAPWQREFAHLLHVAPRTTLWQWLPGVVAAHGPAHGWLSFGVAAAALNLLAIFLVAVGAALRVWGTAYLGASVVHDARMQSGAVMASGPYRFMRNPLYAGLELAMLAMAVLMPVTGAFVFAIAVTVFQLRLILGEEAFLAARLGEPYLEYCARVPRVWPAFVARVADGGVRPEWVRSVVAELYFVGLLVGFAAFSWSYSVTMMLRVVLVSFGVSLVSRAWVKEPLAAE